MQLADGIPVDTYGLSDIGKARTTNQDQFLIAGLHKVIDIAHTSIPEHYRGQLAGGARALLHLVADGVGGGQGGEEASMLTLDTVVGYITTSMRCFYKLDQQVQAELMDELAKVVTESDATVRTEAERTGRASMATTLTMAHVLWPTAYVVQIGDSRCYHFRGGSMLQVTKDQTVAQQMIDAGILDQEHAERSPFKNVLSQAIGGTESDVVAEISSVDLESGDSLLLCTDGLTKHVDDQTIADTVRSSDSAQIACETMLQAALSGGGSDNVTVVLSRFGGAND